MKLSRLLDRRAGYGLASLSILLSMVAPAVIPAFASAALLSTRSITMSSSAKDATGVSYAVAFTGTASISATASAEGGVIIDFCSDTGVLGDTCTAPTGLDLTGATVNGVKYAGSPAGSNGTVNAASGNHIEWEAGSAYTGGQTFEMTINGIDNPTVVGVFYARVTTYTDATNLADYNSATDVGDYADAGSIALAATSGIGVTGYVLESMIFCVSGAAPSTDCGDDELDCVAPGVDAGCVTDPSMTLGEDDGFGNIALTSGTLSTSTIYAQLSSNASGNTVVNLKSNATSCGGLYRNGNTANCNIAPQYTAATGFSAGAAMFGITVGTAASAPLVDGSAGSGAGTFAATNGYNGTDYFIDYDEDNNNSEGVTSTYGSALLSGTGSVDNMNIPVTFGASISNNTPAGTYGATLNMIAVGTF